MTRNAVLFAVVLTACSASPSINVGNEGDGSVAGSGGSSGFGGVGGFGGNDDTLNALITEPPSEMAIEMVTISCAGECKQVLAVASGGNDPYTFIWNDGVTTAAREICAADDTTFTVTVRDTAIVDGEFPYAGQSITASVTANVLTCPGDGGVGDAQTPDALCLENLSFEGTPARNLFGAAFDASPWQACSVTPDIINATVDAQYLAPTDGQTYLGLLGDSAALTEAAGQALCAPFHAGATASLRVDVGGDLNDSLRVQLFGAASMCGEDQLLAEIDPDNHGSYTGWETHCVTVTAASDVAFFKIRATGSAGPYVLIDNLRIVEACDE